MKKILFAIVVTIFIGCVPASANVINPPKGFYPHMGVVTAAKYQKSTGFFKVTFCDADGRKWSWLDDDPSWAKGDFVATIMYDNGTRTVYDDRIVDARYVGCLRMFNGR